MAHVRSIVVVLGMGALVAIGGCPEDETGTGGAGGALTGTGGVAGVQPFGGTGGVGGTAGVQMPSTGGFGGGPDQEAGGTGGIVAMTGGTGGMSTGGVGGMTTGGTGGGEPPSGCVAQAMIDSPTTTAECAACVCNACPDIMATLVGDTAANALIECGKVNQCSGDCCFCNDGASACSTTTCTGYGVGPCVAETIAAAGGTYPSDEGGCWTDSMNATQLGVDCKAAGNSCKKATDLGTCVAMHCDEICMGAPACPAAGGGF